MSTRRNNWTRSCGRKCWTVTQKGAKGSLAELIGRRGKGKGSGSTGLGIGVCSGANSRRDRGRWRGCRPSAGRRLLSTPLITFNQQYSITMASPCRICRPPVMPCNSPKCSSWPPRSKIMSPWTFSSTRSSEA